MRKNVLCEEDRGCVLVREAGAGGGRTAGVLHVYPHTILRGHMGDNEALTGAAVKRSYSGTMTFTYLSWVYFGPLCESLFLSSLSSPMCDSEPLSHRVVHYNNISNSMGLYFQLLSIYCISNCLIFDMDYLSTPIA